MQAAMGTRAHQQSSKASNWHHGQWACECECVTRFCLILASKQYPRESSSEYVVATDPMVYLYDGNADAEVRIWVNSPLVPFCTGICILWTISSVWLSKKDLDTLET
ncbi:hypothetical protein IAQ61_005141 [Plenodomus lingam]|uniref:uncharacterized protein n=1 Tax=Leptosphaeria maculans TaxID=5022 RepID=UPI0033234008|nr:hypothetical protein IAQ61_005141 [Plenodomus lingam]